MFERYTEKARRTIFFARYEASQFGSPYIETEHLLLGLLREAPHVRNRFLAADSVEDIRKQIDAHTLVQEKISTAVDLPLSNESTRVLHYAADEAEAFGHRHIGTEHLFLGLLREENCFAAAILRERGVSLEDARGAISKGAEDVTWPSPVRAVSNPSLDNPIRIHGSLWNSQLIRQRVYACRAQPFHWERKPWAPRDIVIRGKGDISFDLTLAQNPDFELVKGGWTRDHCAVCSWELSSSLGPDHATGYTNGRDWLCTECYEKFWSRPDFFAAGFSDLT